MIHSQTKSTSSNALALNPELFRLFKNKSSHRMNLFFVYGLDLFVSDCHAMFSFLF